MHKYIFMVKIIVITIILVLLLCACANDITPTTEASSTVTVPTTKPTTEPTTPTDSTEKPEYPIDNYKKYIGVYINDPKDANMFDNSLTMLGWFDSFDKPSKTKISLCLDEHKYIAFITLEPFDMPLNEIVEGVHDNKIINYLCTLSENNRIYTELFVRFAHEMEMRPDYKAWYDWQSYDSKIYVQAWQHIVTLGREYAPNVKWVWSPNRADKYTKAYYPGDDYVDYVSLTLNNTGKSYKTFESFYEKVGKREFLEEYNKPIIFGEIAEHNLNDEQKNDYIASVFEFIKNYDRAIGVVFFDKDVEKQRQYKFSDNEIQLRTFIEKAKELKNEE